jgi:hypothetical protein
MAQGFDGIDPHSAPSGQPTCQQRDAYGESVSISETDLCHRD